MDTAIAADIYQRLSDAGALPRYIGRRLGKIDGDGGPPLPVEVTFEAAPSVLWDAMVLPSGQAAEELAIDDQVMEFVVQQWRHNKSMLVPQTSEVVLHTAGVDVEAVDHELEAMEDVTAGEGDPRAAAMEIGTEGNDAMFEHELAPGLLVVPDAELGNVIEAFMTLVARHRSFDRFNGNAMVAPVTDLDALMTIPSEGEEAATAED
jgi:putative intracellular protease/amidase